MMERADYVVGAAAASVVLILVATLLWLSPLTGEHPHRLEASFTEIAGIAERAPVYMRGLEVGRVAAIVPEVTADGGLRFRVAMDIRRRLASGEPIPVPEGTVARLIPAPAFGIASINLVPPPDAGTRADLADGALLPGATDVAFMAKLQDDAGALTLELGATLRAAQALLDSLTGTTAATNQALYSVAAGIPSLLVSVERQLAATEGLVVGMHAQLGELMPQLATTLDTATALLADSRGMVAGLNGFMLESQPGIAYILENMVSTSERLHHFVAQVSERPTRMLSGVRPLGADPVPASAVPAGPRAPTTAAQRRDDGDGAGGDPQP